MCEYARLVEEAREALANTEPDQVTTESGNVYANPAELVSEFCNGLVKRLTGALEEADHALDLEFGGSSSRPHEPEGPIDLRNHVPEDKVPGVFADVAFSPPEPARRTQT